MKLVSKFFGLGLILLFSCKNTTNLDQQLVDEFAIELDRYLLNTEDIFQNHFNFILPNSKNKNQKIVQTILVKNIRINVTSQIKTIISSLNLSTSEKQKLLNCLKSNNSQDKACIDRVSNLMAPFSDYFINEGEVSYYKTIDYMINETSLLDAKIDSLQCQKFRAGVFYNINPFSSDTVKIIRNNKIQIEQTNIGSKTYHIKWDSNCKYHLTPINLDNDTIISFEILNEIKTGYNFVDKMYVKDSLINSDIGILK